MSTSSQQPPTRTWALKGSTEHSTIISWPSARRLLPLPSSRRKLRQWPPDYGLASLMESTHSLEMLALNRQLLDHAGFHGVSSCGTRDFGVFALRGPPPVLVLAGQFAAKTTRRLLPRST